MKNLLRPAAIVLAILGLSTPARAAKNEPFDFSDFKGNYTGTVAITVGPQTFPGTATISVAVPKHGRSAVVTIAGTVSSSSNTSYPILNTFVFARNKTVSQSEMIYGVDVSGAPGSGTYSGKKALTFSTQAFLGGTGVFNQGTLAVRPKGKKHRRLLLTTILTIQGQTGQPVFAFDALAKVKAPKK